MELDEEELSRVEKEDIAYIKDLCDLARQKFSTVQIFVTRDCGDSITRVVQGDGNFIVRFGQVVMWIDWAKKVDTDRM